MRYLSGDVSATVIIARSHPGGRPPAPGLLGADTRRDLVTLQDPVRLVAVQSQCLGELVMRDPVPTVELDEECLLRLPAKVGSVGAKLVCDLRRYLEADGHGLSPTRWPTERRTAIGPDPAYRTGLCPGKEVGRKVPGRKVPGTPDLTAKIAWLSTNWWSSLADSKP